MPRTAPPKLRPLTARQKVALQMTLDGYSKAEIQERLGISQPTLWRWRTLPAWAEQIDVVLRDDSTDGQGQIRSMLPMATRRLRQLIHSSAETIALGACRTALEAHANLVSRDEERQVLTELEQGLEDLRQAARDAQQQLPAAANDNPIDVEIVPDAHADAHAEHQQQEPAQ